MKIAKPSLPITRVAGCGVLRGNREIKEGPERKAKDRLVAVLQICPTDG
jgi:hypothetical protein